MSRYFDPMIWKALPFHFWSLVFFTFGCIVGSFLNVCIYRMPRGESLISPPSHCPKCGYSIPWYLNVPLFTWLFLRGKCANCKASITVRYFLVELLTGLAFAGCWLATGRQSPLLALAYCLVLAGFIVATFIDFEHFIIPDEITIGGIIAGVLCSFAVPALHHRTDPLYGLVVELVSRRQQELMSFLNGENAASALIKSALGIAIGGGAIYVILRIGKLLFGRQKVELEPNTRVTFTETALVLPDQEILYEDLFYRKSDFIAIEAKAVELIDRCYKAVTVRLTPEQLFIGEEILNPEQTPHMEVVTDKLVLPREAMGFGDVKFMAAIGAFFGWQAALFSLLLSSVLGTLVTLVLILLRKQAWSSRLPYGPYIALAAAIWIFGGERLLDWWLWWVKGGFAQ